MPAAVLTATPAIGTTVLTAKGFGKVTAVLAADADNPTTLVAVLVGGDLDLPFTPAAPLGTLVFIPLTELTF